MTNTVIELDPFSAALKGNFKSALRWENLDALWDILRSCADKGWYVYAVGDDAPVAPVSADELKTFISEVDALLRKDHEEDYCGIVYADDMQNPTIIKIYDPHNLGVSCGFSNKPPLPGWILSVMQPVTLEGTMLTASRRRWWQRIFNN